jgi:hypothetical protein
MSVLSYSRDLDLFVRRVKFVLSGLGVQLLADMRYGRPCAARRALSYQLFSSLQVLSYVREVCAPRTPDARAVQAIVAHVSGLIDLEAVGLEPYNLYYRPTHACPSAAVLYHGQGPVLAGEYLLQVGAGVVTRALTPPQPYPVAPAPAYNS